jgi:hypothetical protein
LDVNKGDKAMNVQEGVFFVLVNGQQVGPLPLDQVKLGLTQGRFNPQQLIWAPGLAQWRRIADTPFIMRDLPQPPPKGQDAAAIAEQSPKAAPVSLTEDVAVDARQEAEPKLKAAKPLRKRVRGRGRAAMLRFWQQIPRKKILIPSVAAVLVLLVLGVTVLLVGSGFGGKENRLEAGVTEKVYEEDHGDWQRYPDLDKETKAIAKRQEKCIEALLEGNVADASNFFVPEKQEEWRSLMKDDAEGMQTLAQVLATAQISFLGPDKEMKDDPRGRIAAFTVVHQAQQFEIIWLKYDGTWYLYEI